ncbi:right-handed parallel beta-helix repeat-containing protein [uncultured Brevundimonas sp.]|uniref:right-handed parallel beta-helix repeat-containing protein n=1 Tax=uncultured Brevundimonas sp. TaxID=213418 RepID=UPI00260D7928|nr:right-handed parallel beta-helix repeat-containing protein [uncultured Brevundimonas sp.]
MIGFWLFAALALEQPRPSCTPDQLRELTTVSDRPYRLDCSAHLTAGQSIPRPVLIEGASASGVTLDCAGAAVGRRDLTASTTRPTLSIRSHKRDDGQWERLSDVVVRNCHILGNVRVLGMGADGSYDDLRQSSRSLGHTERAQDAAPTRITLDHLTLTGQGTIPLYIGTGVTAVSLTQSTLNGTSTSTAIYLDAESGHHSLTANRILTRTGREMIAVDGSAHNRIIGNRFDLHGKPAILLYRNCGERGVVRHQTPSNNLIRDNSFTGASWLRPRLVVENARNGGRSYCRDDAGYPFGSSIDDRDNGSGNQIRDNRRN